MQRTRAQLTVNLIDLCKVHLPHLLLHLPLLLLLDGGCQGRPPCAHHTSHPKEMLGHDIGTKVLGQHVCRVDLAVNLAESQLL